MRCDISAQHCCMAGLHRILKTLNPRGRLVAGPRETLKEIPLYEVLGAVHPKAAGPRETLNEIPLYAVPRVVHPKPAGPPSCWAARNPKWNTFVRSPGGRAP